MGCRILCTGFNIILQDILNIIDEVDEDGSGTLDFDEFMEMMAG